MPERLVAKYVVTINGFTYESGPDIDGEHHPATFELVHRDDEASRLTLTVKDFNYQDVPFPDFNAIPNPRKNPNIPVDAILGWEDEGPVRVFAGVLAAKKMNYPAPSQTTFVAIQDALRLRKRAGVDTKKNISLRQFITAKFAEENIIARFDKSIAGDLALTTPIEAIIQPGETHWDVARRWFRANGYITNTIQKNIVVIRRDKLSGDVYTFERGGPDIISLRLREEQKRDEKSGRRRGHSHELKPGRHWGRLFEESDDDSRAVEVVTPAIGKTTKQHKVPFSREATKNRAKRRAIEGDELSLTVRLEPRMRNEEIVVIKGFGPDIDGRYQTSDVIHRAGGSAATTDIEAWRP